MENIKEYLNQLTVRDRVLLVFSISLLSLLIIKFLILDSLNNKNNKLVNQATVISQQENIINTLDGTTLNSLAGSQSSNQLINNFLKKNSASKTLKQIRTTSDGSQRFELEDINFTTFVQLLNALEENAIAYNSLQIKKTTTTGAVDAIMTIQ